MRVGEPIYLNEIIADFDIHWDEMEEREKGAPTTNSNTDHAWNRSKYVDFTNGYNGIGIVV